MKNLIYLAFCSAFVLFMACTPKTGKEIGATNSPKSPAEPPQWETMTKPEMSGDTLEEEIADYSFLNELEVSPEEGQQPDSLAPYNPSHTFEVDLIHTKIDISFDWAKKRAQGKATLTLRPWFYATDKVTLDAKNFDIHAIKFEGKAEQLKYEYLQKEQLVISLGKTFTRNEEFKLVIDYTAKPDERENIGGSAAITSDKGLYFINPDGSEKDKPMQIWTQGETEANSCWFPTVDKPNERCTQEMYITVDNKYKTLSNGILVSSKKNPDGTRTDYWKMDKPHAPYLFMMAIGEFAVVKDRWRGIDVEYYVEPKFEAYARDIYPYTTEMLELFSNKLGYPYPWSKFSQVVVRDYVSGAMENTTAVIFGEFMQANKRQLMDSHLTNEKVVAHEMFHQWFGDLVTTESWANLTMNEGFANYSEYLWLEHKYGRDAADDHLLNELQGYLFSAADGGHPLIHFGYNNREDMFDAHSYNKGGLTLHMLRNYLGDEAFFAGLNRYLKRNEYTDVEAHELRLAFEDVSGQDLNWFWNQWYFSAGHPVLNITYNYDEAAKTASVNVSQIQEGDNVPPIFNLPLSVDIYDASGKARREQIRLTKRNQTFTFTVDSKPAVINFDAEKILLGVKTDEHTAEEWAFLYRHGARFLDRHEALNGLQAMGSELLPTLAEEALADKYSTIRQFAMNLLGAPTTPTAWARVATIAANDPDPGTRSNALLLLGESGNKEYIPIVQKGLNNDQAYSVAGAALNALNQLDPDAAVAASRELQKDESDAFLPVLTDLYASKPSLENLPYFEGKIDKVDVMASFAFFENYQKFILGLNDPVLADKCAEKLKSIATGPNDSEWRRFNATKAIADMRNAYRESDSVAKVEKLQKMLDEIKAQEKDATLKMYYDMF